MYVIFKQNDQVFSLLSVSCSQVSMFQIINNASLLSARTGRERRQRGGGAGEKAVRRCLTGSRCLVLIYSCGMFYMWDLIGAGWADGKASTGRPGSKSLCKDSLRGLTSLLLLSLFLQVVLIKTDFLPDP